MGRVFLTRVFSEFVQDEKIDSVRLCEAVDRFRQGAFDANLGGGLYKIRIAQSGGGKAGGYRTILGVEVGGACFFLHGFAKNERENISRAEKAVLLALAARLFTLAESEIDELIRDGSLEEICHE